MNDPCEPPFTPIEEMFAPPHYGPHEYTESNLRQMWSFLWSRFKSRRLCNAFMMHHRTYSLAVWREAAMRTNPGIDNIHYIRKIANRLEIERFVP